MLAKSHDPPKRSMRFRVQVMPSIQGRDRQNDGNKPSTINRKPTIEKFVEGFLAWLLSSAGGGKQGGWGFRVWGLGSGLHERAFGHRGRQCATSMQAPLQDAAVALLRSHHFIVQFLDLVAIPEESAS